MTKRYDDTNCKDWKPATKLVRGGLDRSEFGEVSEALFMTQAYAYDSPEQAEQSFKGEVEHYVYSRYGNPTVTMFEDRLKLLEGADHCVGLASGMAAVFSTLASQVKAGDRVVASRALFGACYHVIANILPNWGVEVEFVDGTDLGAWEAALSKPVRAVFLESPSNPTLEIIDIEAVADLTHKAGGRLVVDNAFASPVLQHPLDFGADVVTYSATKHIDGQGRSLGGAVLSNDRDFIEKQLTPFYRNTGPSMSPFNAWLLLKGLETLELRVTRQCENATAVAAVLETQDRVERVIYPGLKSHPQHALAQKQMGRRGGTLVTFELKGGKDAAFAFLNKLKMIDIANNLGDAKSLITHPATTTHQRLSEDERLTMGITQGMVRLSLGIEDARDIQADLEQALA